MNNEKCILKKAMQMSEQGNKNNIDAVLQVSVSANEEIYEAIRRCDKTMCDALRKLMKEEFEETKQEAKQETLLEAIKNVMEAMKCTAEQAMTVLKIPEADKGKYSARL